VVANSQLEFDFPRRFFDFAERIHHQVRIQFHSSTGGLETRAMNNATRTSACVFTVFDDELSVHHNELYADSVLMRLLESGHVLDPFRIENGNVRVITLAQQTRSRMLRRWAVRLVIFRIASSSEMIFRSRT
jgi:hypothetical protein